jgi:hypothetical protein
MVVGRDAVRNRQYTDDEVVAMRAAWEAASAAAPTLFASRFAKQYNGKSCWGCIYRILLNRSYQWLLPGHPYRIEYDRKKAEEAAAAGKGAVTS